MFSNYPAHMGRLQLVARHRRDVLATWQPETHEDIEWLEDDCDAFNAGADLEGLEHCPGCQEVSLDIQEVQ